MHRNLASLLPHADVTDPACAEHEFGPFIRTGVTNPGLSSGPPASRSAWGNPKYWYPPPSTSR